MRKKLPAYAVNCLLAAGFDSASSMNVTEGPNNSIEVIETFTDKHFRGNEQYYSNPALASRPFVFPPGHKIRIANFVSEASSAINPSIKPKRKQQGSSSLFSHRPSKIPRIVEHDVIEPGLELNISSVSSQVRGNISRWVKAQSCDLLRSLKENQHFQVIVSKVSGSLSVNVRCKKNIALYKKSSNYLISNWTRHVKLCKMIMTREGGSQKSLGMFITTKKSSCPESTETSSHTDTDNGNVSETASEHSCSPNVSSPEFSEERENQKQSPQNDQHVTHPRGDKGQVFHEAPPAEGHQVGGANSLTSSVSDWSREGRRKKLLVKAASDIKQTCTTQYYDIVDEIERLSHTNEVLSVLQQRPSDQLPFSPVLKQIIVNAERNATALPQAKRHPEVLKKFATALLIYAGPLAYNFLQKNLHEALPSLRTVQRIVHAKFDAMNEEEFCFDGLAAHIAKHNTVGLVSIHGDDATCIICRVEFDAIEEMFTTQTVAKY